MGGRSETSLLLGWLDSHTPGMVDFGEWEGSGRGQGREKRPDPSWEGYTVNLMLPGRVHTDLAGLGAGFPARLPSLPKPDASWGFSKPPTLLTNWQQTQSFPWPPRFNHLLDQLTELRQVPSYKDGFLIKAVGEDHANEETHRGGSRTLSCVSSPWNQDVLRHPPGMWLSSQPGSSSELRC